MTILSSIISWVLGEGAPFLLGFLLSVGIQFGLIRILASQRIFQVIYGLSPQTHRQKSATPSFGGLGIVAALWIILGVCDRLDPLGIAVGRWVFSETIWFMTVLTLFALLGFWDDAYSKWRKENRGLSAKAKLACQVGLSLVMVGAFHTMIHPLSEMEFGLYVLLMTGFSNAANLTDGLDGLLAGLTIITYTGFGVVAWSLQAEGVVLFCGMVAAVVAGFLFWNLHPARIFMGDTGSLSLGAMFVGLAMVLDAHVTGLKWLIIPFGAVYAMEAASVMVQVAVFKRTRKRVFLMAPLHHHFELMGLSEPWVVRLFWAFSLGITVLYLGVLR